MRGNRKSRNKIFLRQRRLQSSFNKVMIRVFIEPLKEQVSYIPLLFPNLGALQDERHLFADRGFRSFTKKVVDLVENVAEADFILLPHDYFYILERDKLTLARYLALARENDKKLLIFDFSDYSERTVDVPNAWIFRVAGYRHHWRENEIMMPYFVEDLSNGRSLIVRVKGEFPLVGFCGWADFKNVKNKIKSQLKAFYFNFERSLVGDMDPKAHEQGILFRSKIIRKLIKSDKIRTNFIIRKAYGSHTATIELDPDIAREQYIENIMNSDFSLAIRGDANFSQRFYEILSLGRIPIFFDTDCVLPLENEINYEEFMLRIDYRDIKKSADIIASFYENITPDQFKQMQEKAREAFEMYLKADIFFSRVLPGLIGK